MITSEVPFSLVRHVCESLGFHDPELVREIRFRAPGRYVEVLTYAKNADGSKFIGEHGVVLEAVTIPIERIVPEDEIVTATP